MNNIVESNSIHRNMESYIYKTKQHATAKMIKEERKISKNKNGTFLFRKDATVKSKILNLSVKFFMTFTLNVYIYFNILCINYVNILNLHNLYRYINVHTYN